MADDRQQSDSPLPRRLCPDKAEGARLLALLDRIKQLLWHGNQHRAGEEIAFFEDDVDGINPVAA